ncbi:SRPBCC family protein [Paenibacillus pini]|uniref:Cell division inhibitor n=1 Tax=Paenibacillus pini JCM 16418 TaxID=1236976 RepID=W7Y6J6_9BACL|nr:SRPBCC family protein [Paenibacillus pini]GAF06535.1 hypothetical protein JCM16418_494 [Paenibacillus pini JCM 16418]
MVTVTTNTVIDAPISLCFDLARDIDLHTQTVWKHTKERAIAGTISGKINGGEMVTFEATHFFIKQRLTSRVIEFRSPYYFVDEMMKGTFKSMKHEHTFEERSGKTLMVDTLTFTAPFGVLGWVVERLILKNYMKRFLEHRNRQLKMVAESIE